jgi:hypothetical protein
MFVAAAVESRDAQEKAKKPQFLTKFDGILSFTPCWMEKYFFFSFFFQSYPIYDQTQGSSAVFSFLLLYG